MNDKDGALHFFDFVDILHRQINVLESDVASWIRDAIQCQKLTL